MGAVDETRKAIQDFLAPEIRSLATKIEALHEDQNRLRSELKELRQEFRADISAAKNELKESNAETRQDLREQIVALEARISALVQGQRTEVPLLVRNAILEQSLLEKQRLIDELQRHPH